MSETCCIKGCDLPVTAMGMCVNHWRMNRAHGSPVAARPLSAANRGLTPEQRFWKSVQKTDGCWFWTAGTDKDGYGAVDVTIHGVRTRRAHRYSYMLHTGEVLTEYQIVMHSCDRPACVNPAHLSAGTPKQNSEDMVAKERHRVRHRSQAQKISRISEDQVRAILRDPRAYAIIAAEYGVHKQHVLEIKSRRQRASVEIDPSEIVRHVRGAAGEARSKNLKEDDVRAIRASAEQGRMLAKQYGVSEQTISDIRKLRSWRHVA